MSDKVRELAAMIDHSILHPTMTDADLREGCAVALAYGTATVCVKPCDVSLAASLLKGSRVKVCTVAGFPHGSSTTSVKVAECRQACVDGAAEVDMVVNIGKLLGGDIAYVEDEVRTLNTEVLAHGATLKVIFENDYLQDTHKEILCRICSDAAVAFVKTSTGYGYVKGADGRFSTRGATLEDLRLMRRLCPPTVGVKAAGGVRTLDEMLRAIEAGANRIGAGLDSP
ncbi:MAG: deoxyribose-phosphate aldolase, partial [Chitinophagia bacterium]|nr:deoxyribose-phosphate aldolase [Chitinophagia bacterium]